MRLLLCLLIMINLSARAQALRDVNFNYIYSPDNPVTLNIKPVRRSTGWEVFYKLKLADANHQLADYSIQWEIRTSLNEKEGKTEGIDSVADLTSAQAERTGKVLINASNSLQFLVAKVINIPQKTAWFYYKTLEPKYPGTGHFAVNGVPFFDSYIPVGVSAHTSSTVPVIVSYYNDNFPAATPASSESVGRVSTALKVDSTFQLSPSQEFTFFSKGLYLVQQDTMTAEGFTIRAESDYPRLSTIESLSDPLAYICTSQELSRLRQAKGDKRAFDKIILSITRNTDRAKILMRNYFRRVELANLYFTSYKEGWKTDRGMIYIIFGLPNEVYKTNEREIWFYKNADYKIDFEFTHSPTLFDPENYVLIRRKKNEYTVNTVIDLIRNGRL